MVIQFFLFFAETRPPLTVLLIKALGNLSVWEYIGSLACFAPCLIYPLKLKDGEEFEDAIFKTTRSFITTEYFIITGAKEIISFLKYGYHSCSF